MSIEAANDCLIPIIPAGFLIRNRVSFLGKVGGAVAINVGKREGTAVGIREGFVVVGILVGIALGIGVGTKVGCSVGLIVGTIVGNNVGSIDG